MSGDRYGKVGSRRFAIPAKNAMGVLSADLTTMRRRSIESTSRRLWTSRLTSSLGTTSIGRLLRWLLKLSYNDDRTRPPPYEMQIFVPYILGNAAELSLLTTLLLSLITPSKTTSDMKTRGIPDTLEPESCGVGRLYLNPPAKADVAIGRIVQINSYLFSVIAWRPRLSRPTWRSHIANICRVGKCFELRPRAKSVRLNRASMDFVSFQSQHMIRHWNPFRTTGGIS